MGKTRKRTTARKQAKAAGRKKQEKENAATLNEPINSRERMIMAMAEIGYVSLCPFYDNNSNILLLIEIILIDKKAFQV